MKKFLQLTLLLCLALPTHAQEDGYDDYAEAYAEDGAYDEGAYDPAAYGDEGGELLPAEAPAAPPAPDPALAPVEPAPKSDTLEKYIPLFAGARPTAVIDPANPRLPENHPLLRLKGTIWRNDEVVLSTNGRGLVSAQRVYLVFDRERDAVAFTLAPYNASAPSFSPRSSDYISLVPLLETNMYQASPYQNRYVEIPEKYRRPTTNAMMSLIPPMPTNAPGGPLLQAQESNSGISPADPANLEGVPIVEELAAPEDGQEVLEDIYDPYAEEAPAEGYPEDAYSLKARPLKLVAQNADAGLSAAVVNIGGLEGGIFVQETRGAPETPYTVLFLALEKDGSLSAYTIQNSFDIRLDTPEIIQARGLYKRAFEMRANMKRFTRMEDREGGPASSLMNFFK